MDLSELGLSEEQMAGVTAYTTGLKANNDSLLSEKKAAQLSTQEALDANEAAKEAAVAAEKLRLSTANDTEGLKKLHAQEMATKIAEANGLTEKAQSALSERDKSSIRSEILSKVDEKWRSLVKTQLGQDISIAYGEDGKMQAEIRHGETVYSSVDEFLDGVKDTEWKNYLTCATLSGAGTQQSTGASNNNASTTQSNLSKRLKKANLIK